MTTTAPARHTDAELREILEYSLRAPERSLAGFRQEIAAGASIHHAAGFGLREIVVAEVRMRIIARALAAPADKLREALAAHIAEALGENLRTTDAFGRAAAEAAQAAGKELLRELHTEIDTAELIGRLY